MEFQRPRPNQRLCRRVCPSMRVRLISCQHDAITEILSQRVSVSRLVACCTEFDGRQAGELKLMLVSQPVHMNQPSDWLCYHPGTFIVSFKIYFVVVVLRLGPWLFISSPPLLYYYTPEAINRPIHPLTGNRHTRGERERKHNIIH